MKNKIIYGISFLILILGIYMSDLFSQYKDIYGVLTIFVSFILSIAIFSFSENGKNMIDFLKKCQNELKYIEWVKKEELNKMTIISFLIIFATTLLVLFFDSIIFKLISLFLY